MSSYKDRLAHLTPEERANYQKMLRQARDPSTDPKVLASFMSDADRALRGSVMRNPNTPLDAMLSMVQFFPRDFCQNPALALHMIEHPDLAQHLTEKALHAMSLMEECPDIFFQLAFHKSKEPAHLRSMLKTKRCSAEMLRSLYHSIERRAKREYEWMRVSNEWFDLRKEIAAHPNADWPLLSEMLRREPHEVREFIIKRPLGDALTVAMVEHSSPVVRRAALQRALTREQAEKLASDEDKAIKALAKLLLEGATR